MKTMIKFIEFRFFTYIFSSTLLIISFFSFFTQGFNFSIDFTGGNLVQVRFKESVDIKVLRDALKGEDLIGTVIQRIGEIKDNIYIIKTKSTKKGVNTIDIIKQDLIKAIGEANIYLPFDRSEEVGPTIGKDLRRTAYILVFISLIAMLTYIAFRFTFKYSTGGIIALAHDVCITLGFFSILRLEVDLTTVAAVLTIIGYSINDTIVVYDRIRENMKLLRDKPLGEIIDISITTTLSRTIITSFTVLMVVVILFFFGGTVIHNFAFAFIVGVIFGTYSSIFVATPLAYDWEMHDQRRKQQKRQLAQA